MCENNVPQSVVGRNEKGEHKYNSQVGRDCGPRCRPTDYREDGEAEGIHLKHAVSDEVTILESE